MTTVQKLKTFLQQTMIARIALYAIALIFPAGFALFMVEPVIHTFYDIVWIGFYCCMLLFWLYHEKTWEIVLNVALLSLYLLPVGFLCFASLMGGILGPVWALATLTIPLPLMELFNGPLVRLLIVLGWVILLFFLIQGIRFITRKFKQYETRLMASSKSARSKMNRLFEQFHFLYYALTHRIISAII